MGASKSKQHPTVSFWQTGALWCYKQLLITTDLTDLLHVLFNIYRIVIVVLSLVQSEQEFYATLLHCCYRCNHSVQKHLQQIVPKRAVSPRLELQPVPSDSNCPSSIVYQCVQWKDSYSLQTDLHLYLNYQTQLLPRLFQLWTRKGSLPGEHPDGEAVDGGEPLLEELHARLVDVQERQVVGGVEQLEHVVVGDVQRAVVDISEQDSHLAAVDVLQVDSVLLVDPHRVCEHGAEGNQIKYFIVRLFP